MFLLQTATFSALLCNPDCLDGVEVSLLRKDRDLQSRCLQSGLMPSAALMEIRNRFGKQAAIVEPRQSGQHNAGIAALVLEQSRSINHSS